MCLISFFLFLLAHTTSLMCLTKRLKSWFFLFSIFTWWISKRIDYLSSCCLMPIQFQFQIHRTDLTKQTDMSTFPFDRFYHAWRTKHSTDSKLSLWAGGTLNIILSLFPIDVWLAPSSFITFTCGGTVSRCFASCLSQCKHVNVLTFHFASLYPERKTFSWQSDVCVWYCHAPAKYWPPTKII